MKLSRSSRTSEPGIDPRVKKWVYAGFWTMLFLGTVLHFVFELCAESPWVAAWVPVNESLWEHLKLGYTPLVLFSLLEYRFIGRSVNHYFEAKLKGIVAMCLVILIGFECYTLFTVRSVFWMDIGLFVAGAVVCHINMHSLYLSDPGSERRERWFLVLLILLGLTFAAFTWYPPEWPMFMDNNTRSYGIPHQSLMP